MIKMKVSKSRWLAAAFAFLLIPGLLTGQQSDQDKPKDKSKDKPNKSGKAPPGQTPYRSQYPPGKGPTPAPIRPIKPRDREMINLLLPTARNSRKTMSGHRTTDPKIQPRVTGRAK